MKGQISRERREIVFGTAVLLAGYAITSLCLMPLFFSDLEPHGLFPTAAQEKFFFDLFGLIGGCWLLSWVSAVNDWSGMSRVGQWLGIILLCVDEAILISIWRTFVSYSGPLALGIWIAPVLLQTYLLGCFFGFFTMPALTRSGNRTLTGLGTLVLLLPWLFGRDAIVTGTEYLHGLFF